jgi:hypothetical protein
MSYDDEEKDSLMMDGDVENEDEPLEIPEEPLEVPDDEEFDPDSRYH